MSVWVTDDAGLLDEQTDSSGHDAGQLLTGHY